MSSISLSIRPSAGPGAEDSSISDILKRINKSYGHFRNVTEDDLEEKVPNDALRDSDDLEDEEIEEDAELAQDAETRREEVYAARSEILKCIDQAQNEALTALDFISLLMSKDAPRLAEQSMSPVLKQMVRPGSLSYDKSEASLPSDESREDSRKVALGWNLQSLDAATDRLMKSASRLEKEMQKEARYWEQVLSVREKGWMICRMPRERHTLGARFGFSEASPNFYAQGLAALRSDETGNLYLDQGSSRKDESINVQILHDGRVVGVSTNPAPLDHHEDTPLEDLIEQARDSLFDAELFSELGREARELLSYGVAVSNDRIRFPVSPSPLFDTAHSHESTKIECLVTLQGANEKPPSSSRESPDSYNVLADSILLALRILLTDTYRRKARYRKQPAPPISEQKHSAPSFSILEPVMYLAQHTTLISRLDEFVKSLASALAHAGFHLQTEIEDPHLASASKALQRLSRTSTTPMEEVLQHLCAPMQTDIKLKFGNGNTGKGKSATAQQTLRIAVSTQSSSSDGTRGTLFSVTTPGHDPETPTSLGDVEKALVRFVQHSISHTIAHSSPTSGAGGWKVVPGTTTLVRQSADPPSSRHFRLHAQIRCEHSSRIILMLFGGWSDEASKVCGVWTSGDDSASAQGGEGGEQRQVQKSLLELVRELPRV